MISLETLQAVHLKTIETIMNVFHIIFSAAPVRRIRGLLQVWGLCSEILRSAALSGSLKLLLFLLPFCWHNSQLSTGTQIWPQVCGQPRLLTKQYQLQCFTGTLRSDDPVDFPPQKKHFKRIAIKCSRFTSIKLYQSQQCNINVRCNASCKGYNSGV